MKSDFILYLKMVNCLKSNNFKLNRHDHFFENNTIDEDKMTSVCHMYNMKTYHMISRVLDKIIECSNTPYQNIINGYIDKLKIL